MTPGFQREVPRGSTLTTPGAGESVNAARPGGTYELATGTGSGVADIDLRVTRSCVLAVTQTVWHRLFAFATAILFLLSWVFPIGAGLAKDTTAFPKWWGTVDVAVAFVLAIAAFGIQMLVRGKVDKRADEAAYRIYRTFTHGIIAVAVLVMLAGDRITWVNCATGFLWRAWLALYILPWWLTALRSHEVVRS